MIGSRSSNDYRLESISSVAPEPTARSRSATANSWLGDIAAAAAPLRCFPAMPALTYRHLLAAAGLVSLLGLAAPDSPTAAELTCIPEALEDAAAADPLDAEQKTLAAHLARRFQVAGEGTGLAVFVSYRAASEVGLDPLLVLAMISIESSFNPAAESSMGAKGLMQIIPRFHLAKLEPHGGAEAVLDPESNILVGAR